MKKEIPVPMVVAAVIVAVLLLAFVGKMLLPSPATAPKGEEDKYRPGWTKKGGGAPNTGGR